MVDSAIILPPHLSYFNAQFHVAVQNSAIFWPRQSWRGRCWDQPERLARSLRGQPVFNGDTLFPVESGFERDVTDLLVWLQISLFAAAPRLRITIKKPLFAIPTPKGLCRPDFVLETTYGNHPPVHLVVEAMGMDTEQYVAAKAKTLPRMREIGPLCEITPADMSPANARALGADLQRWVLDNATSRRLRLING